MHITVCIHKLSQQKIQNRIMETTQPLYLLNNHKQITN